MKKVKVLSGMKVKVVGSAHLRYQYSFDSLTLGKVYNVITGFGEEIKDPDLNEHVPKFQLKCGINEFEIINDEGEPCWATLTGLEDEPIFELLQ